MDLQQCFCMLDEWKQEGNVQNSQNIEFQSTHTMPVQLKRRDFLKSAPEHTLLKYHTVCFLIVIESTNYFSVLLLPQLLLLLICSCTVELNLLWSQLLSGSRLIIEHDRWWDRRMLDCEGRQKKKAKACLLLLWAPECVFTHLGELGVEAVPRCAV